jgi:diguanylate cyclase (GGDEF)-like protein
MFEDLVLSPANQFTTPLPIQIFALLLFCVVSLVLWHRAQAAWFGFWSLAWGVEALALTAGLAGQHWARALLEFCFAFLTLIASRSAPTATFRGFWSPLRTLWRFPGLLLLAYLPLHAGWQPALLALIYGYALATPGAAVRKGGTMLRFALAFLCLDYLGEIWLGAYNLVPQTLLAFSAVAIWIQTQQDTIAQLRVELDSIDDCNSRPADLDHLTGLQNRAALDRHLDEPFTGVVAVCDMDYFKDINDRFGHLVGDDVLRSVGNLIRASIRAEDDAFRWGGDEFVIVFRNQHIDLARGRMAVLEERLQTFRIRGYGPFPLGLSWGAAEGDHSVLRPILEDADRHMYERKRVTHARKA